MDPSADLLSLVPPKDVYKKAPSKRNHNHLGAPSGIGSISKGKRKAGNEDVEGETEADSAAGSGASSQEDEDADDENDDDDDEEEPAVDGPVRANRKRKYTLTEEAGPNVSAYKMSAIERGFKIAANSQGSLDSAVSSTGRPIKGRTYSMASTNTLKCEFDAATTETEDEPDYPRKKALRRLSTGDDLISIEFSVPIELPDNLDSDTAVVDNGNDYEGDYRTSIDLESLAAPSDDEIVQEEAEALVREFELNGPDSPPASVSSPGPEATLDMSIYDELLSDHELFADTELRDDDPHAWSLPSGLLYHDGLMGDDLFPVPASREDTPPGSPTPRPRRIKSPVLADPEVFLSDGWSDDEQLVEEDLSNPFFEQEDPAVKHLVSTQWGGSGFFDDSDDEDDVWLQAVSSSSSSAGSDDESSQSANGEVNGDESEEEYDSDATDEDEELPMPTPIKESKLRRLSSPVIESPQVIRRDPNNRNGPFLGSWIADPTRPICIIDGTKKTILIPSNQKRFSLDSDASYQLLSAADDFDTGALFSQSGQSCTYGISNPTLSGFTDDVDDGGYLNGADICGPPEAFNPSTDFMDFDDLLKNEYDDANDDSVDEDEQVLSLEDVLALSESEDEGDNDKHDDDANATPNGKGTGDLTTPNGLNDSEAEATLSRWDFISVTAFRKRQQQHKQRLAGFANIKGRSVMKGKLTSTDTTMTPARRRKVVNVKNSNMKPPPVPKKRH